MKQQSLFCYLPLAVHKDICTCQLREILSPQTTWCTFRADCPVTENSEQHLDVVLWPHIFKCASLLLLRSVKGTVQYIATVNVRYIILYTGQLNRL